MDKATIKDDQMDEVSGGTIISHQVQPGDTLGAIADRYHVSLNQLLKWNNIQNPNLIMVGQQLKIKY